MTVKYSNGDVSAEGSGAGGGAPLLRPSVRFKGRLPEAGDRETEDLLFQPEGWPEFQNVWRQPEPDILEWRPCGSYAERDTSHNEFIMRRFPVATERRHSGALPHDLAPLPP